MATGAEQSVSSFDWRAVGVIVALIGVFVSFLWNWANWRRTSRLDAAVRFEAVHGQVLDVVLETLGEASETARKLTDEITDMNRAAETISGSLRPLITRAQHRFTTEIGTLSESELSRSAGRWVDLAQSETWDDVYADYQAARGADTFPAMNNRLNGIVKSIEGIRHDITMARISENKLGQVSKLRRGSP